MLYPVNVSVPRGCGNPVGVNPTYLEELPTVKPLRVFAEAWQVQMTKQ